MGTRKSAADLTDAEIAKFLEAIIKLKATDAPGTPGFSLFDQYVALHGAVMGVITPTSGAATINFAHGSIGFLPWHRQYLLEFEQALTNALGEEVNIPYWDWADAIGAANRLFTADFLSSLRWGNSADVTDGMLGFTVPASQRPNWWPNGFAGFRVDGLLAEGNGTTLERGSMEMSWPPSRTWLQTLVEVDLSLSGRHPLWVFWLIIEQGIQQLPQTHNAAHRFVGGHMGGAFSPNDPVFWLHHANVDRLWDAWQQNRINTGLSANHLETYPVAGQTSPFDGRSAPEGHKVGDIMWPWFGGTPGYEAGSVSVAIRNRLPTFANTARVEDVLRSADIGVDYQSPQAV